ncbi:MAG: serine/threonine-protein phosphatase [Flavipsychrobacter sp.]|jgi:serine/threonine protein phosphatase PrpC|nr:serine/threonine-protein phosphatase [Flavipsychrobacter sp.]
MIDILSGMTDTGRLRSNNEDAFIALQVSDSLFAACVIDGVGGYNGGEVAAAIAKETIEDLLRQPVVNVEETLEGAIRLTNARIFEEKLRDTQNSRMACVLTLAIANTDKNQLHYIHIGDTRLYLFRDGSLVKLTRDHSFVGFLEDSGRMDEQAAMEHPRRNEINKALGFDEHIEARSDYWETGTSPFLPGDLILVCSDGLTDMVPSNDIIAVLSGEGELQNKCERLIKAANDAGGKDNVSVVIVQNYKQKQQYEALRPSFPTKLVDEAHDPEVVVPTVAPPASKKNSKWLIIAASIVLLLIVAILIWLKFKGSNQPSSPTGPVIHAGSITANHWNLNNSIIWR